MSFLFPGQYEAIVIIALPLKDAESTSYFFHHHFKEHKNDNPNFAKELKKMIDFINVRYIEVLEDYTKKAEQLPYEIENKIFFNELVNGTESYDDGGCICYGTHDRSAGLVVDKTILHNITAGWELFNEMEKTTIHPGQPEKIIALKKIVWKGNLKEFAEMFDSLEKMEWIDVPDGELTAIVKTLCACFDFTATKKTEESNTEASLTQYLKVSERETKIYTQRYQKKFNLISENNTKK